MTERLEEINAVVKSQKEAVRKLSYNDLKWLIAQAKRTEGLEEVIECQNKDVARLLSENQRYKQALEFYANEKNYERAYDDEVLFDYLPSEIDFDNGEKARKALEVGNND